MKQIYRSYKVNDMVLLYLLDSDTQTMGFTVLPEDKKERFWSYTAFSMRG